MSRPRQSPSPKDFNLGYSVFKQILEDVDPDMIILWGNRLWSNIPKNDLIGKPDTFAYFKFNKEYPLLVLPHPSSTKFSYNLKQAVDSFIEHVTKIKKDK